jgi:hypothetical protein
VVFADIDGERGRALEKDLNESGEVRVLFVEAHIDHEEGCRAFIAPR